LSPDPDSGRSHPGALAVALDAAAPTVARRLLGKVLVSDVEGSTVRGRIVEVEAYDEHDPASHSFRGPTPRSAIMFGPPGRLYVYLSYGVHRCANVVVGPTGSGQAVLLRAVAPLEGVETMTARRGRRTDLADGPGKLCQAFGIELDHGGVDLLDPASPIRLVDDGTPPPAHPLVGPRIGITKAVDTPWRFRTP
jgi:DNA-3-methyladenine glycosylase